MSSVPDFSSILDASPTEVERPKALPAGTYLFTVGRWNEGVSSQKKTPLVKFDLTPVTAMEDVDEDELAAALTSTDGSKVALGSKTMSVTYYTTPAAIFMLDEFHEHCGLDLADPMSRKLRNDEVLNTQVQGYVEHRPGNNGQVFAEVRRTLPAD